LPLSELITEHVIELEWQATVERRGIGRLLALYCSVANRIAAMERHCMQCATEINRGDFDLLLANPCRFFRVSSIGRFVKVPKVIYLQEPYRRLYEAMPRLPWLALPSPGNGWWRPAHLKSFVADAVAVQGLRLQAREEYANAQAFDTILANSHFSRESILRAYGLDAKVCYLGIDTELFKFQPKRTGNFVLGVGAFVPEKNIEFVIKALAMIPKNRPKLVWIGNVAWPAYLDQLVGLARSLGVCFEARQGIGDLELIDTLQRAMMLLYAPRLEPFGLAPLEASACGVPVIAVAEGGVRETVVDGLNGLVVEHDPGAMAQAVQRLLNDTDYAQELGRSGRRMVLEQWSLTAATERLERALVRAIS
jgi:glycosyltransferase involved in cell wall biosynthesis